MGWLFVVKTSELAVIYFVWCKCLLNPAFLFAVTFRILVWTNKLRQYISFSCCFCHLIALFVSCPGQKGNLTFLGFGIHLDFQGKRERTKLIRGFSVQHFGRPPFEKDLGATASGSRTHARVKFCSLLLRRKKLKLDF